MSGRATRLLKRSLPLALVLVFLVAWGVRAIVVDDTPGEGADSLTLRALEISMRLVHGEFDIGHLLLVPGDKILPVPLIVAVLTLLLFGPSLAGLRLGGVLCYALLIWQTHDLARRAGASTWIAAGAALFVGVCPVVYGWSRLAYPDIHVAACFTGCLQLMIRGHLNRHRALALGLLGGLGMLTKFGFMVCIALPGAWFAAGHLFPLGRARSSRAVLRSRRINLAIAAGVAALIAGLALAPMADQIAENLVSSTRALDATEVRFGPGSGPLQRKLDQLAVVCWHREGMALLWGSALLGLVVLRRSPGSSRRVLLGLASLGGLGLTSVFDIGVRYLVPQAAPAAVLGVLGFASLARRVPIDRRITGAVAAAALVAWFVWLNVGTVRSLRLPFSSVGMLRPVATYHAACREIHRRIKRGDLHVVYREPLLEEWLVGHANEHHYRRCRFPRSDEAPPGRTRCRLEFQYAYYGDYAEEIGPNPGCIDLPTLTRFTRPVALSFRLMRNR